MAALDQGRPGLAERVGPLLGPPALSSYEGLVTALINELAAGLQLAALSLRGQPDAARFVAAFTGSHRYVLDFLAWEVLERQSEQVRTFLLETSVLERAIRGAVRRGHRPAGQPGAAEQAERAGLFTVPLDEVRGWWRYHHLFADLLRARLRQEQHGRVSGLHHNAATWYEKHGLADDAIRHAAAAGELTWAAKLIEQHFDELYFLRGEGRTIQRWLSGLSADLVRTRPRLLLAQALLAAGAGRIETMEPLVEQLTSRELEVLQMLAAGKSNQVIAGELVVTLDTVKKHVSHVLGKLGATNRTEAVARARELGLIP